MKHILLLLVMVYALNVGAQTNEYDINFKDPKSVANTIYHAAKTYDYLVLMSVADPCLQHDGDIKQIVGVPYQLIYKKNESVVKPFVDTFKDGEVLSDPTYYEEKGEEFCSLKISFNRGDEQVVDDLVLVKRYGNWYLYSF